MKQVLGAQIIMTMKQNAMAMKQVAIFNILLFNYINEKGTTKATKISFQSQIMMVIYKEMI